MRHRPSLTCTALALTTSAAAQAYPSKPIRFSVPFPPGGGNDTVARTVGFKPE